MSLTGTVKLFNPSKGFGFILSADGQDIFLHVKSCVDEGVPQKGDIVKYDMSESPVKPGQMQASNITGGTGQPPKKGGGSYQGACKSFNELKGFGFIIGPDGSDIFYHAQGIVDGSTPQAGDMLNYDLEPSKLKPDQVQAENITGGTGFGKGGGKGFDDWGKGGKGFDDWGKGGKGFDAWGGKGGGKFGGGDDWGKGGGKWGGGGDDWGAAKGKGKGGDDWGPYGGGGKGMDKGKGMDMGKGMDKGDGGKGMDKGKGKGGGKMEAVMAMISGMMGGGGKGGDSWGGKGW